MTDAPSNGSSPRKWAWCFEKLPATLISLGIAIGAVVGYIFWFVTIPEGGIANKHTREASAVVGDKGQVILTYEVYNPGPGELSDIHLEIDVEDAPYDGDTKTFGTGLVCQFLQTTSGIIETNGKVTSITAMPHTGGKCCEMSPGDSFSVSFAAPDENWRPKRATLCYSGGGAIDILKIELPRNRSIYTRSYAVFVTILIVLVTIVFMVTFLWWKNLLSRWIGDRSEDIYAKRRASDQEILRQAEVNQAEVNDAFISKLDILAKKMDNKNGGDSSAESSQPSQ